MRSISFTENQSPALICSKAASGAEDQRMKAGLSRARLHATWSSRSVWLGVQHTPSQGVVAHAGISRTDLVPDHPATPVWTENVRGILKASRSKKGPADEVKLGKTIRPLGRLACGCCRPTDPREPFCWTGHMTSPSIEKTLPNLPSNWSVFWSVQSTYWCSEPFLYN